MNKGENVQTSSEIGRRVLELAEQAAQEAVAIERERCAGIALSFRGSSHTDKTCETIAAKIRG